MDASYFLSNLWIFPHRSDISPEWINISQTWVDNIHWIFILNGWIWMEIADMPTLVIPEYLHQQHLPPADDCQGSHLGDILYYILYYCLISRIYGFPHRLLSTSTSQDKKPPNTLDPPPSQLYTAQSPTSYWSLIDQAHHQSTITLCLCLYFNNASFWWINQCRMGNAFNRWEWYPPTNYAHVSFDILYFCFSSSRILIFMYSTFLCCRISFEFCSCITSGGFGW